MEKRGRHQEAKHGEQLGAGVEALKEARLSRGALGEDGILHELRVPP
ncbi:MAG: hypothetical protein IMF16_04050 [Proteobacteria bacterium]|nr:hypothetical protein [Pseudomonadota bacterium]